MLVNELKPILDKYDKETLIEISVLLYRKIPKSRKDSDSLDEIITNYLEIKTKPATTKQVVDFNTLKSEIELFFEHADKQYYYYPNKVIRNDLRPKWRFHIKRYIKELIKIKDENSEAATLLLMDIYDLLSYACYHYIFNAYDPFGSVGYSQRDFLTIVLERIFSSGYTRENIKRSIFLVLNSNYNYETTHMTLNSVLVGLLKTPDTKRIALECTFEYQDEVMSFYSNKKLFVPEYSKDYFKDNYFNFSIDLITLLKFKLYEYDEGIEYYLNNYIRNDDEVTLYCLLKDYLSTPELSDLWIREFEKAKENGMKIRDSLKREYKKLISKKKN